MHVVVVVVARAGPGAFDVRQFAGVGEVHVCGAGASGVDALPGVSTHDDARGVVEALRRRAHIAQRGDGTVGDDAVTTGFVLLVHDAARPVVPAALTAAVVTAVRAGHPVVVPVLPLADTVKEVGSGARVVSTPDRSGLRVVQTPQGFHGRLAERVLPVACADPVHAWAAAGEPAHAVPGDPRAAPVREDA